MDKRPQFRWETNGVVQKCIKGMEQKGFLTTELSENDHRSHHIDFTPKGLSVFERARPVMRKRQRMLRDCLEPDELEQLFHTFDKLDAALDEMEDKL